jgi:hypothetical protein
VKGAPIVALLAVAALVGCHGAGDSPRAAAERFLDAHYVNIDLEAAKQYSVGVARFKVEEEQRLVGDQQIDASTRRPHVSYRMAEQRDETGEGVALVYDATLRFDDGETTALHWLITTRRDTDGTWKVSNYQEYE